MGILVPSKPKLGSSELRPLPVRSNSPVEGTRASTHGPTSTHLASRFGICSAGGSPSLGESSKTFGRDRPNRYRLNSSKASMFRLVASHFSSPCWLQIRKIGRKRRANYFLWSTAVTQDSARKRARDVNDLR